MSKIKALPLILVFILGVLPVRASLGLVQKLSGRILLQVQSAGQAWYVNPRDLKKYYLGRPNDAFSIMKFLGQGITNENLNKINIGLINNAAGLDADYDGLTDDLENAIGTDKNKNDTDDDGYDDKTEIENNYNPNGNGALITDNNLLKNNLGKIFLQVEAHGEAWYINPSDGKKYFLGRPDSAFQIMKTFGLGITNTDLAQIPVGQLASTKPVNSPPQTSKPSTPAPSQQSVLAQAADSIRNNDIAKTKSYFTENMQKAIQYTMEVLNSESKLLFANILSGASLESQTDTEKIYSNDVYFSLGGYKVPVKFYVNKQPDGSWLITNL